MKPGLTMPCCFQIPEKWRGVWEPHDPETPCRIVADGPACVITFDGCCLGNPGVIGAAAVVGGQDGKKHPVTAGGTGTNNEAEYRGLILGLQKARQLGFRIAVVHGDSELVIRQMRGVYAVRSPALKLLHADAVKAAAEFLSVTYTWIPRESNGEADRHSRIAAKAHRSEQRTLTLLAKGGARPSME